MDTASHHDDRGARPRRLRPVRRHGILDRALYTITHRGHVWTVDVDLTDADHAAELYRDGVLRSRRRMPAALAVPGGVIEVDAAPHGVTRAHLVLESGRERRLDPVAGTLAHLRGLFAHRHPGASAWLGGAAVAVLVADLALLVAALVSPAAVPGWPGAALVAAGLLAAAERALALRGRTGGRDRSRAAATSGPREREIARDRSAATAHRAPALHQAPS